MAHEDLNRIQAIEGSSDRAFGWVFAAFFLIIGCWPLMFGGPPRWWSLLVSGGFGIVAVLKPTLLAALNRLWMKFGILLGKIVSPIALGVLFYGVVTPIGVMIRMAGKDPLRLKRDSDANSYWIARDPPGPPPDSMNNQF